MKPSIKVLRTKDYVYPSIKVLRTKDYVYILPYVDETYEIEDVADFLKDFEDFYVIISIPENSKHSVAGIRLMNLESIEFSWNRMSFKECVIYLLNIAYEQAEKIDKEFPADFKWGGNVE